VKYALIWAGMILCVAIGSLGSRGLVFDDPYICFRYASNLAAHGAWAYNYGISGTDAATSPLYVLMLALMHVLGMPLEFAATVLFVMGLSTCAFFTFRTLESLGHQVAGLVAAALLIGSPWIFVTRGMESAPFLAALAISVYLWRSGRSLSLGVTLATLVLIRPDGAIPMLLILAGLWMKDHKRALRALIAAFAVAGIWLPYQWVVIGQLVPGTLAAKIAQGSSGLWGHGDVFIKGLIWVPAQIGFGASIVETIVGLFAIFGIYSSLREASLRSTMTVVMGSALTIFLVYSVMDVPPYTWYYTEGVYAATIAAGIAIERCALGFGRPAVWDRSSVQKGYVNIIAACAVMLLGWFVTPAGPPRPGYRAAAEWLDHNTSPSATVTSAEIGILGFYSHRVTLDYLGLVTPEAVAPMSRGDMTWWVNGLHPDYWMAHRIPWPEFDTPVITASWFHHSFREVYRNEQVVIYRRIDASP
jgi:uncharacterized protein with PQ loop repeat